MKKGKRVIGWGTQPGHRQEDQMKALRFYAPEDVRLEDVPEPECGPDEVKIKVMDKLAYKASVLDFQI